LNEENNSISNVFTEEDRNKIRQTLTHFGHRQKSNTTIQQKVVKKVPNINNQKYHVSFKWTDWPPELDEVPHLFLLRVNLWPYLHYKHTVRIEYLQNLCIESGISSIATKNSSLGFYMSGIFDNGGCIKNVYLTLIPQQHNKEIVVVDNCTFKTYTD
tara:strand:+ start:6930 stop:7400 length:471 start_codon:yes stop_codon:yes gene_type:complete